MYVLIPLPSFSVSLSLSHLLVPYRRELAPFTVLPSPWSGLLRALTAQFYALLLQLLHGEQSRQIVCEDTEGNELALCLVLTYRRDHVVKSVGQAFNKRKGRMCKMSLKGLQVAILERKCQDLFRNEAVL